MPCGSSWAGSGAVSTMGEREDRGRWWEIRESTDVPLKHIASQWASIKVVTMDDWRQSRWPDRPHP
jgi:hypothetical protein